jgi:hypothetical protein
MPKPEAQAFSWLAHRNPLQAVGWRRPEWSEQLLPWRERGTGWG